MNNKKIALIIILAGIQIFFILGCSASADESIVWSDDFNDGNLDGWDTWWQKGLYSVDEGVLSIKTGGDLYHESTIQHGTWSFDLYLDENTGSTHEFRFTEGTYNFQNMEVKQDPDTQIWITTQRDGSDPISSYKDLGGKLSGWHHFDVTKDETGLIKVYMDSELLFEHFDDREFDAEKLVIMYCCDGPVLDNLVVRNQVIDVTSSD